MGKRSSNEQIKSEFSLSRLMMRLIYRRESDKLSNDDTPEPRSILNSNSKFNGSDIETKKYTYEDYTQLWCSMK